MIEFINSCVNWVRENWNEVILFLTSGQCIAIGTSLVLLVKNVLSIKKNTQASDNLKKSLNVNNQNLGSIGTIKSEVGMLRTENANLKTEIDDLRKEYVESCDVIMKKLNCMLEVQSLVYSTIKDDTIRSTVNSILINAKYAETESRAKIKEEIESLKEKLNAETENVKSMVEQATETIDKIIEPEKTEFVRY